jgi:hypothetical protein
MFEQIGTPTSRIGLAITTGWASSYGNASSFLPALFARPTAAIMLLATFGPAHPSLLGATPAQLHRWGYRVGSVPSVDAKLDQCLPLTGDPQVQCWAELDQILMEKVVPVVPIVFINAVRGVSSRVADYAFDQSTVLPALDRIVIKRGAKLRPAPAGGRFRATLTASTHTPAVGRPWRVVVRVADRGGRPLRARVVVQVLFGGVPVGTLARGSFVGTFTKTVRFPVAAKGQSVVVQAVVTAASGRRELAYPIRLR